MAEGHRRDNTPTTLRRKNIRFTLERHLLLLLLESIGRLFCPRIKIVLLSTLPLLVVPICAKPSDFTGTIAGNRHYSTGTIEGPLLVKVNSSL